MLTFITAQIKLPGLHRWPEARESVKFLAEAHRHIFTFKVSIKTAADDQRNYEFFELQQTIKLLLLSRIAPASSSELLNFGSMSCETIATSLLQEFLALGYPIVQVEVWEDDENGATAIKVQDYHQEDEAQC